MNVLEQILRLLPAIGTPKLTGNLGSLQNIPDDNLTEIVLAEAKLSDPFKPAPMTVTVQDISRQTGGAVIGYLLWVRVQFGTGGVMFDTGFNPASSAYSASVCADWIRLSARIQGIPAIPVLYPIKGAVSLGAIARSHSAVQGGIQIDLAAGATSAMGSPPPFAKALMVFAEPPVPFDLILSGAVVVTSFAAGEKTGWIPVASEIQVDIINRGVVLSQFRVVYAIEF